MSAESNRTLGELNEDLIRSLIAHQGLPADSVKRIVHVMRTLRLSLGDALRHIGLEVPDAAIEAIAMVGESESEDGPGIIETVVRRQSASRNLVVRTVTLAKPNRRLVIAHAPEDPRSERIRALRTELLLLNEPEQRANMVALLSPSATEGRSQLAAELAISFSQLGQPTLLVDADLRKPCQHLLFETDNSLGLTHALTTGRPPEVVGVEGFPHLSVLTSGPAASNPSELLSSRRVDRLLGMWRHDFHFVVVDTPPIGEYSDGLIMATLVGRVLVLSRSNFSTHRSVKEMLRRLVSTQSRILGSVINSF